MTPRHATPRHATPRHATPRILFLSLFLIIFSSTVNAALDITKDGDLTATEFDELGFDTTGLVGYWQLNGNANDSSGQGNHGTIVGATATTDRFGTANMAMSFDGTTNSVNIGNPANLNPDAWPAITLSAWINTNIIRADQGIIGKNRAAYRTIFVSLGNNGLKANQACIVLGDAPWLCDTTVLSINTWYHIVSVATNAGRSIYLNGSLVVSDGVVKSLNTTGCLWCIGMMRAMTGPFSGKIDEVKIFNRALTDAEILSMYNHEKGKFSVGKDGTMRAVEFVEDPALPVQMRSKKQSLTVKGQLIEE